MKVDGFKRILVIQLRQMGDVVLVTPALRALKRAHPAARLAFLTEETWEPVLRGNPHVDEFWLFPRSGFFRRLRMIRDLRRRRFDLVVDFHANPRTALIARLTGAPVRLGPENCRHRRIAYTILAAAEPGYTAYSRLTMLRPLGIDARDLDPEMIVDPGARAEIARSLREIGIGEGDPVVAVQAVSKYENKTWPAERAAALADALAERHGAKVFFLGGPGEEEAVRRVMERCRRRHFTFPGPGIPRLMAFLDRADLYVGLCSGPRHVAAALGTPSVTVMGPQHPIGATHPAPIHRAVVAEGVACRPCNRRRCFQPALYCMEEISVDQVLAAIREVADAAPDLKAKLVRSPSAKATPA